MTKSSSPFAEPLPWDQVAEGYAVEADRFMLPFTQEAVRRASVPTGARVLDVAAGPGTLALHLASQVAKVQAVDFSEPMLEQLRRRRDQQGASNVEVQWADGQHLPFQEESFDAAFSMFGLMFFPDRERGFEELYRTLRKGGVAVVSSWAPVARSPLMQLMFGALAAADPSREPPKPNLSNLENPTVFEDELARAGFVDVRVDPYRHVFEASGGAEPLWARMCRGSAPLLMLATQLGPERWAEQSEVALAYLRSHLPRVRELSSTAFIGFGRRAV